MIRLFVYVLLLAASVATNAEQLDRIIAVANDEVILESELIEMERAIRQRISQRDGALPPTDVLRQQVLERLILQHLQLQQAARQGIRVGDDSLNETLRQIASNNSMSLREFRGVLEKDGFDYPEFRESIRHEMIIGRLRKTQVEDKIVVSDREVDNFLATLTVQGEEEDSYHLLHILISVPDAALPEQVQTAQMRLATVQKSLAEGISFSEVATSYSDGQNALEGGDLGWRKRGELPSLFVDAVPELSKGEVSPVIRSGSGFHLVKLKDKRSEEIHMVKQTKASHILIRTNALVTDEQAKQRLIQLKERVEAGEDFSGLARAHSDDTGSAIEGGSLGWASPGMMVPEFEEQMNAVELGEMSEVFKSRFGWHLILVEDRREEDMAEEFNRTQARKQIHQRKVEEQLEAWLRQLRDEAYVEYRES